MAFAGFSSRLHDFYPAALCAKVDYWNVWIHQKLNNGIYRTSFAQSKKAYELAVRKVFETLDAI